MAHRIGLPSNDSVPYFRSRAPILRASIAYARSSRAVSMLDDIIFNEPGSNVRTIVPQLAERRLTREFRGVLTNVQWQALLNAIWCE
jgi:hypothetical protein